jgi:hypothetical protein
MRKDMALTGQKYENLAADLKGKRTFLLSGCICFVLALWSQTSFAAPPVVPSELPPLDSKASPVTWERFGWVYAPEREWAIEREPSTGTPIAPPVIPALSYVMREVVKDHPGGFRKYFLDAVDAPSAQRKFTVGGLSLKNVIKEPVRWKPQQYNALSHRLAVEILYDREVYLTHGENWPNIEIHGPSGHGMMFGGRGEFNGFWEYVEKGDGK